MQAREPTQGHLADQYDYRQTNLLPKIIIILKAMGNTKIDLDEVVEGWCAGLSTLFLYCAWKQTQPRRYNQEGLPVPRDDLNWFYRMQNILLDWDGNIQEFTIAQANELKRFIILVGQSQHPEYQIAVRQGHLDHILEDTNGRKPNPVANVTGNFDPDDFYQTYDKTYSEGKTIIDLFTTDGNMLIINSPNHVIAMFRDGDNYLLYNSNNPKGHENIHKDALRGTIQFIYDAMDADAGLPLPLNLKSFSFDNTQTKNISLNDRIALHANLLRNKKDKNMTGPALMNISLRGQDTLAINHLLKTYPELAYTQYKCGSTPLHLAAHGQSIFVKSLLDLGADPRIKTAKGSTPADLAEDPEIKRILIEESRRIDAVEEELRKEAIKEEQARMQATLFTLGQEARQEARVMELIKKEAKRPLKRPRNQGQ